MLNIFLSRRDVSFGLIAVSALALALAAETELQTCKDVTAEQSIPGKDGANEMNTTLNDLVPIKEILHVKIIGANDEFLKRPNELYVEFSHHGKHGRSVHLNEQLKSLVSLPLLATEEGMQEPVKCSVKRTRWLRRDETLFQADVLLQDEEHVVGALMDPEGRDTGAQLELGLFDTEWEKWEATAAEEYKPPRNMDLYFKGGAFALQHLVGKFYIGGTEVLKKPTDEADPNIETVSLLNGMIEYPLVDEFFPIFWEIRWSGIWNWLLPFSDQNSPSGDRVMMRNELRTETLEHTIIEPYEGHWKAPLSDASMHRVFFSSLGQYTVRKVNDDDKYSSSNVYVADMMYLKEAAHRKGLENLGCNVYFDGQANITTIEDYDGSIYRPGDELWDWAKQKARSAAFVIVSIEHLMQYHLKYANVPGMSLRMFLPPEHPIRQAFTPHFYRTASTCYQAEPLLVVAKGPIHRALPFTYEGGLEKIYIHMLNTFELMPYPDELEKKGLKDDEYHVGANDGVALHKIITNYVSNLFDEVYTTEEKFEADDDMKKLYSYMAERLNGVPQEYTMSNVKMVWGEIIFRVTGLHTSIGNVAVYALEPFAINFRMNKEDKGKVVGNHEAISVVSLISGITVPDKYPTLSQDWSNVMHDEKSKAYGQMKNDLNELGELIDKRNKVRRFVNRDFHPEVAAISIFS